MAEIDTGGRTFTIGSVFSQAFSVMGGAPLAVFGISFLFGAVPQAIWSLVLPQLTAGAEPGNLASIYLIGAVGGIFLMTVYLLSQGALIRVTIDHSEGRPASMSEAMKTGGIMLLPLLGLGILTALAVGLGFILLIVPGIMLGIMWCVAAPALVDERTGIIGAFGRSRELTKGARWKIFGLVMVLIILIWILAMVVGLIMISTSLISAVGTQEPTVTMLVLGLALNTVFTALFSTVINSLFVELRRWKDGLAPGNLAEVFS